MVMVEVAVAAEDMVVERGMAPAVQQHQELLEAPLWPVERICSYFFPSVVAKGRPEGGN